MDLDDSEAILWSGEGPQLSRSLGLIAAHSPAPSSCGELPPSAFSLRRTSSTLATTVSSIKSGLGLGSTNDSTEDLTFFLNEQKLHSSSELRANATIYHVEAGQPRRKPPSSGNSRRSIRSRTRGTSRQHEDQPLRGLIGVVNQSLSSCILSRRATSLTPFLKHLHHCVDDKDSGHDFALETIACANPEAELNALGGAFAKNAAMEASTAPDLVPLQLPLPPSDSSHAASSETCIEIDSEASTVEELHTLLSSPLELQDLFPATPGRKPPYLPLSQRHHKQHNPERVFKPIKMRKPRYHSGKSVKELESLRRKKELKMLQARFGQRCSLTEF